LQDFIKVLKQGFCFDSIIFLDILSIDLNDSREAVDNKLLKKGTVINRIPELLNINNPKIGYILQLGNLQQ